MAKTPVQAPVLAFGSCLSSGKGVISRRAALAPWTGAQPRGGVSHPGDPLSLQRMVSWGPTPPQWGAGSRWPTPSAPAGGWWMVSWGPTPPQWGAGSRWPTPSAPAGGWWMVSWGPTPPQWGAGPAGPLPASPAGGWCAWPCPSPWDRVHPGPWLFSSSIIHACIWLCWVSAAARRIS